MIGENDDRPKYRIIKVVEFPGAEERADQRALEEALGGSVLTRPKHQRVLLPQRD
jgi:hypothetical protein